MTIFTRNGKRINIYAKFTDSDTGEHGIDLTIPANRARFGITEIAEPTPPADYSEDVYYRTEQEYAPHVVYVRRSDEQIKQIKNDRVWVRIEAAERKLMIPRQLREFLLEQPGVSSKPWYAKIKQLDDEVTAMKAELIP